jgi:peptide/nickel transport system substrate-binding protein
MGPQTWESMANIAFQPMGYYNGAGEFVPCLATALAPAADKTYMDITLRQGVKFHDGSVFNAKVCKWNMDKYTKQRPSTNPQWNSVEVLSDYKVRVKLNYWTNTIYYGLANLDMASEEAYEKNGEAWANVNPVGTGPFKFVEYQRDAKMTFTKFVDYWEKGKPYMDGVENIYLTDPMTTQMAFEAGKLDLCYLFLGKQASELKALGFPYNELSSALCPVHALVPSNANPESPLSSLKVRQAISLAFDRKAITDALGYGWLTPVHQIAPPGALAYIPGLETLEPDSTAKAKQLLEEAGHPTGFKTRLIIPPNWANQELASAMQSSLAKIGIQATIEYPEQGKFAEYRWTKGGWHDGLIFQEFSNWTVYTMHPSFYWWRAGATPQYFDNAYPAGFDDLVNQLLTTTQIDVTLAQKFNKMLYDDKTCIPLYQLHMAAFLQPGIHTNYLSFAFKNDWLAGDTWIEKPSK